MPTNANLTKNHTKKIINLQMFRGLAAMMVLVSHANLIVDKSLFSGLLVVGRCGVDFFFVLSGFIIYHVNYYFIGHPVRYGYYIRKRFNRIYPIYWIYTLVTLAIHFVLMKYTGKGLIYWINVNLENILRSLFLYPVNTAIQEASIIPVAWTLSYEIVFYVMFSLLILLRKQISMFFITIWVVAVIINSVFSFQTGNLLMNVILNVKNLEFFMGCMAAYFFRKYSCKLPKYQLRLLMTFAVLLLAISWCYSLHAGHIYDVIHKMDVITFGIPFFIIILCAVLLEEKVPANKASLKNIFIYLGDASYSIYLTHFVTITLVNIKLGKSFNSFLIFSISVLTSIIVGCLLYRFIEKPLLNWLNKNPVKIETAQMSNMSPH